MVPPPLLLRAASSSATSTAAAAAAAASTSSAFASQVRHSSASSPPPGNYNTSSSSSSRSFSTSRHAPTRPRRRSDPTGASRASSSSSTLRSFHTSAPRSLKGDPYATLGVSKSASAKDIKAAYYDLAKKLHPDVNKDKSQKAKDKFVEIQEAYDVLGDADKKARFDQYGTAGNPFEGAAGGGGAGAGGFNPFGGGFGGFGGGFPGGFGSTGGRGGTTSAEDIFESLFGSFGGGAGGATGRGRGAGFAGQVRGDDLETAVNITFEEACRGTTRNVTIHPVENCSTCSGNGMKKGARKTTCKVCNGTGQRTFVIQSGFQMASTCPACGGVGETTKPGDQCGSCEGVGRVRGQKTVQVKIPPGVDQGAKIRLEGAGDVPIEGSGPSGSLYVQINVRPSTIWKRQGSNLHYAAKVPLHVALLGGKVRVPTLDGDVDVRVPAGTQVGDEMLLKGRGVQSLMRRGDKGDLLVGFQVTIPRSLTPRQREILQMYADDVDGKTSSSSTTGSSGAKSKGSASESQSQSKPESPPSSSSSDQSTTKKREPASSEAEEPKAAPSSKASKSTKKASSSEEAESASSPENTANPEGKNAEEHGTSQKDDTNAKDESNQGEERKDGKRDGGGKKDASI